jgi:hypothetical protein
MNMKDKIIIDNSISSKDPISSSASTVVLAIKKS